MSFTVEIRYSNRPPETKTFTSPRVSIGRDAGDIVLNDPQTSGRHAQLEYDGTKVTFTDLTSTNGSFDAAGNRIYAPKALAVGEAVRMGGCSVTVTSLGDDPMAKGKTMMVSPGAAGQPPRPGGAPGLPPPGRPPAPGAPPAGAPPTFGAPPSGAPSSFGGTPPGAPPTFGAPPPAAPVQPPAGAPGMPPAPTPPGADNPMWAEQTLEQNSAEVQARLAAMHAQQGGQPGQPGQPPAGGGTQPPSPGQQPPGYPAQPGQPQGQPGQPGQPGSTQGQFEQDVNKAGQQFEQGLNQAASDFNTSTDNVSTDKLGALLKETWSFIQPHIVQAIIAFGALHIAAAALGVVLGWIPILGWIVKGLASLAVGLGTPLAAATVGYFMIKLYIGEPVSGVDAWKTTIKSALPLWVNFLVAGMIMAVGFNFFFVPGVALGCFLLPVFWVERKRLWEVNMTCLEYFKKDTVRLIVVYLVGFLVPYIAIFFVSFLLAIVFGLLPGILGEGLRGGFISGGIMVGIGVIYTFIAALSTRLYFEARAADGTDAVAEATQAIRDFEASGFKNIQDTGGAPASGAVGGPGQPQQQQGYPQQGPQQQQQQQQQQGYPQQGQPQQQGYPQQGQPQQGQPQQGYPQQQQGYPQQQQQGYPQQQQQGYPQQGQPQQQPQQGYPPQGQPQQGYPQQQQQGYQQPQQPGQPPQGYPPQGGGYNPNGQ